MAEVPELSRFKWSPNGRPEEWQDLKWVVDCFVLTLNVSHLRNNIAHDIRFFDFQELVSNGFYDDCRFFRVLPGFIAQFGINGNPDVMSKWRSSSIPDDPVKVTNSRGTVVFATAGPNTRTTQIFVNTRQQGNAFLDKQGFSPFGVVLEGMDIVDKLYAGYGEGAPGGKGPNQALIQRKGNSYLTESYPNLSYISKATISK